MPVNSAAGTTDEVLGSVHDRNEYVESFAKGLDVLSAMSGMSGPATISEIAAKSGQGRASARRYVLTLVRLGHAEQKDHGYRLLPNAVRFGNQDNEAELLARHALPRMRRLVDRHREASSCGTLEDASIRIMAYARSDRLMSIYLEAGDRLSVAYSAQGRVLLAALSDDAVMKILARDGRILASHDPHAARNLVLDQVRIARKKGFAIVDEELEKGVRSLAVPIISPRTGDAVAAISVCAHSNRMSVSQLTDGCLPDLQAVSEETTISVGALA
ncbi:MULTISPECIES: IclR family transcriptional regulator domain-containing protein [Aurantimonas]|nr:IclR family transcriptional regulator C-terminal domain-containing protein [Aurantimonas coralicida]